MVYFQVKARAFISVLLGTYILAYVRYIIKYPLSRITIDVNCTIWRRLLL